MKLSETTMVKYSYFEPIMIKSEGTVMVKHSASVLVKHSEPV